MMTILVNKPAGKSSGISRAASRVVLVGLAAVSIAACRPDYSGPQVAGWSLTDPAERHPILVSQQPETMTLPVRRGSYGLTNSSRAGVARFLHRFRATDNGKSKLVISAPSGGSNEVAGMQVVAEIREMIGEAGFAPSSVHVEANRGSSRVRLSYLRLVAQGPECGLWQNNLARSDHNLPYLNFGCANQANLAAMIANPADLLGPRTQTPRIGDRRDAHWKNYVKGESTGAKKSADERVSTRKSD